MTAMLLFPAQLSGGCLGYIFGELRSAGNIGRKEMPRVCFVIVFFGKIPQWFGYFARSCELNPGFDWLILYESSVDPGVACPANLRIVPFSRENLEERVGKVLGCPYRFSYGYKLCDLKPAYGDIFEDLLTGYDYWGYADLDVVWGNLCRFVGEALDSGYDVITARKELIVGHCTLIRNKARLNRIYRDCDGFPEKLLSRDYEVFDEKDFHVRLLSLASSGGITLWRKDVQCDDCMIWWQGRPRFIILWFNGALYDVFSLREIAYFHFIQSKHLDGFRFVGIGGDCSSYAIDSMGGFPTQGVRHVLRLTNSAILTFLFTLPWYLKIGLKRILPKSFRVFLRKHLAGFIRINTD